MVGFCASPVAVPVRAGALRLSFVAASTGPQGVSMKPGLARLLAVFAVAFAPLASARVAT
jgi:hypothetical protein